MKTLLIIIIFLAILLYGLRRYMTRYYNQKLKDINEGKLD